MSRQVRLHPRHGATGPCFDRGQSGLRAQRGLRLRRSNGLGAFASAHFAPRTSSIFNSGGPLSPPDLGSPKGLGCALTDLIDLTISDLVKPGHQTCTNVMSSMPEVIDANTYGFRCRSRVGRAPPVAGDVVLVPHRHQQGLHERPGAQFCEKGRW